MAKYTGLKRSLMTVPARGTASFDFTTNQPNYFRVQNRGTGRVYGSTGSMPTQSNYDFYVDGEKVKLYAQPHVSNRLYIYNPSGSDVTVVCVSFYAEFDPLAYALGDIEVTIPEVVNSNMTIQAFNAALPSGSNTIGKVGVNNFPTDYAKASAQKDYTTVLAELKTALDSMNFSTGFIDNVNAWEVSNTSDTHEINAEVNGKVYLHLLTNDGNTTISVEFTNQNDGQVSTFSLRAGESIQDLKFTGKLYLKGTNYSFRVIVSYD